MIPAFATASDNPHEIGILKHFQSPGPCAERGRFRFVYFIKETIMDQPIHETTEQARSGTGPGVMRYVLGISLFLAIAALTIVWVTGALGA